MNQLTSYDVVIGVNDVVLDGGDVDGYTDAFQKAMTTGMVILRLYTGAAVSASTADIQKWQATQK